MAQLVKYNWQQTDRKVVVKINTRDARNCRVEIRADLLIVSSEKFRLECSLLRKVNIYRSFHKVSPQFVVITLEKRKANVHWTDLVKTKIVLYDRLRAQTVPIVPTEDMMEGEPSQNLVTEDLSKLFENMYREPGEQQAMNIE